MICDRRGHRWRAPKPFMPANQSRLPQTLMFPAEVIDDTHQIHARFQRLTRLGQRATAPYQAGQALPKRRVEPLDEGRVDDALTLAVGNQSLDVASLALHQAALDAADSALLILFNCLRDEDARPSPQARSSALSSRHRLAKDQTDGVDIALQAIGAKQQTQRQGTGTSADLRHQRGDQSVIAAMGNRAAQPQAGADHYRKGHPDDAALLFDPQFVHLHLPQVTRGGNQLFMHGLAMPTGALLPISDGALVERESGNDGLRWTAVRQQGDNLRETLIGVAQAVKGRAFRGGEGLMADRAFEAPFFLRMNGDVALLHTASSRASEIRTKYGQRVQGHQSFRSGIQKGLSLDPRSIQIPAPPRLTVELPGYVYC